ncbi:hypothetical protein BKA81DRAFT_426441 [Phyllosticta paracitricarpa]
MQCVNGRLRTLHFGVEIHVHRAVHRVLKLGLRNLVRICPKSWPEAPNCQLPELHMMAAALHCDPFGSKAEGEPDPSPDRLQSEAARDQTLHAPRYVPDASSRLWKGPSAGTLSSSAHHASSQPAEAQKTVTGETDAAHAGPSNFFKHRCDSFKGSRQTLRGHPSPFIMPATRVAGEAGAPHVAPPKLLRTPPRLVAEQSSK